MFCSIFFVLFYFFWFIACSEFSWLLYQILWDFKECINLWVSCYMSTFFFSILLHLSSPMYDPPNFLLSCLIFLWRPSLKHSIPLICFAFYILPWLRFLLPLSCSLFSSHSCSLHELILLCCQLPSLLSVSLNISHYVIELQIFYSNLLNLFWTQAPVFCKSDSFPFQRLIAILRSLLSYY